MRHKLQHQARPNFSKQRSAVCDTSRDSRACGTKAEIQCHCCANAGSRHSARITTSSPSNIIRPQGCEMKSDLSAALWLSVFVLSFPLLCKGVAPSNDHGNQACVSCIQSACRWIAFGSSCVDTTWLNARRFHVLEKVDKSSRTA